MNPLVDESLKRYEKFRYMNEFFFTIYLTENEHYIIEEEMREQCAALGITLKYYRKFKEGHIPGLREVKVVGSKDGVAKFKKWIKDKEITIGNYHRLAGEIFENSDKYDVNELFDRLKYAEWGGDAYAKRFPN